MKEAPKGKEPVLGTRNQEAVSPSPCLSACFVSPPVVCSPAWLKGEMCSQGEICSLLHGSLLWLTAQPTRQLKGSRGSSPPRFLPPQPSPTSYGLPYTSLGMDKTISESLLCFGKEIVWKLTKHCCSEVKYFSLG